MGDQRCCFSLAWFWSVYVQLLARFISIWCLKVLDVPGLQMYTTTDIPNENLIAFSLEVLRHLFFSLNHSMFSCWWGYLQDVPVHMYMWYTMTYPRLSDQMVTFIIKRVVFSPSHICVSVFVHKLTFCVCWRWIDGNFWNHKLITIDGWDINGKLIFLHMYLLWLSLSVTSLWSHGDFLVVVSVF